MSDTPDPVKALAGRIGGYTNAARNDTVATTASARAAFLQSFERHVDPDGVLAPAERARRAIAARKAYFARLAMRSANARRQKGGNDAV